jgi:hypothetical protein
VLQMFSSRDAPRLEARAAPRVRDAWVIALAPRRASAARSRVLRRSKLVGCRPHRLAIPTTRLHEPARRGDAIRWSRCVRREYQRDSRHPDSHLAILTWRGVHRAMRRVHLAVTPEGRAPDDAARYRASLGLTPHVHSYSEARAEMQISYHSPPTLIPRVGSNGSGHGSSVGSSSKTS